MKDNLTFHTRRLRDASLVADHLASQIDDIRTTTPVGFGAGPSFDGVARPVETTVEGLVLRGVTDAVIESRRLLAQAAELTERACRSLERARDSWESPNVT